MHIQDHLSCFFSKGSSICDFLFFLPVRELLMKRVCSNRKDFAPKGAKSFLLEQTKEQSLSYQSRPRSKVFPIRADHFLLEQTKEQSLSYQSRPRSKVFSYQSRPRSKVFPIRADQRAKSFLLEQTKEQSPFLLEQTKEQSLSYQSRPRSKVFPIRADQRAKSFLLEQTKEQSLSYQGKPQLTREAKGCLTSSSLANVSIPLENPILSKLQRILKHSGQKK